MINYRYVDTIIPNNTIQINPVHISFVYSNQPIPIPNFVSVGIVGMASYEFELKLICYPFFIILGLVSLIPDSTWHSKFNFYRKILVIPHALLCLDSEIIFNQSRIELPPDELDFKTLVPMFDFKKFLTRHLLCR